MKTYILLFCLMLLSNIGVSQSKQELQKQVTNLTSEKQKLFDDKQKLMEDILILKQQILDLKTENITVNSENDKLRNNITPNSNNSSSTSTLGNSNQITSKTDATRERCLAITAAGTQCTRLADIGSKYCWQHKATYEPGTTTTNKSTATPSKSSGTSVSSSRTIQTGPRGGQYYINKNGNKTYIKKK